VKDVADFRNEVASIPPGSKITLSLLRNGKGMDIEMKVGSLDELDNSIVKSGEGEAAALGLTVKNLTPELAEHFGYENQQGVLIAQVKDGSAAQEAGLEPGLLITGVNRRGVASVKEFIQALERSRNNQRALILVTDGETSRFVTLPLEE
jgi:serine protease Do